jgi:hypothetical protein
MLRNVKALFSAAAFVVAAAVSVSVAAAQDSAGAPALAAAAPSPQVVVTAACGSQFSSRVTTQNAPTNTNNTAFANLAGITFSVPSGQARCVKVLFTAEAACTGSGINRCYVRAIINGVEMFPQGGSFQALQSEDSTEAGHAYEWFRRVGPGNYTVFVQRRSGNSSTFFFLDDWTADFVLTF